MTWFTYSYYLSASSVPEKKVVQVIWWFNSFWIKSNGTNNFQLKNTIQGIPYQSLPIFTNHWMMQPNLCLLMVHILTGVVATPLLLFSSMYQLCVTGNIGSSIFLLLSAILAMAGLHLNILLFRQRLDEWYDPRSLQHLKVFSLFVSGMSLVYFGYSLTKGIRQHRDPDKGMSIVL